MQNLLCLLLLSFLVARASRSPTSGPTLVVGSEKLYESVIHTNASWVANEMLWEVREIFVNLTRPLGDAGCPVGSSFNLSVSLQLNRTFTSISSIYARVEGPSGLAPLCNLCPVDSSGLHACTSGALTKCAGKNPIDASLIDANLLGGSLTFRVMVRGAKSGFSAGLRLSQNPMGTSGAGHVPTSSPTPTYGGDYDLDPAPMNLTSVSVWLIIVVFFVILCSYRVYRAHRINTILAMRANGSNTLGRTRGSGSGSAHGVEDYDDGMSAYPSSLSRHLQMNQLNMNPILQTPSARLPPVVVVDSIPSAQVRVLSPQEAAGLPRDNDATPRAVAIGVVGTHRL